MRPEWLEYHETPVELHSGGWSHWLVRGDLIYKDERVRELVLDCWTYCMGIHSPEYRDPASPRAPRIYGVPDGGTVWAEALAHRWGTEPLSAYSAAEDAGPTFIVDDVATTGESLAPYPEPRLVVVRRGSIKIMGIFWDMHWLPVMKDKPIF